MRERLRTVNLISGSGSTNLSILKAEQPGGELYGLAQTVAIISSDPEAGGIKAAKGIGFPPENIHVVDPKNNLAENLNALLDRYDPDYFHQLGWMPLTPVEVLEKHKGLNQHLGPGGKWMYGIRRIYAHMRFCEMIGEARPIPVFCQRVAKEYDAGDIIYVEWVDLLPGETPEGAAKRLLEIEHKVQKEALRRLATNAFQTAPVPKIAKTPEEEELLLEARKEARDKYPNKQ